MKSLYVSQSQYRLSLRQEFLQVRVKETLVTEVPLPHLEQVLIFGTAQVTTQAIHACLQRRIPILFFSCLGYCSCRQGLDYSKLENRPETRV